MVIISNSSRRASTTIDKMKSLGFDTSLFVGAVTSGELTHQYLQRFTFKIAIHYALFHDGQVSTSHMLHFLVIEIYYISFYLFLIQYGTCSHSEHRMVRNKDA
jgi:hypothetical protein